MERTQFIGEVESIYGRVLARTGDKWSARLAISTALGYYDAKYLRYMSETHGFSVVDAVMCARRMGFNYKVPYEMLRYELKLMGKKESSIDAMMAEVREFDEATSP